jgi:hypothetical protein
MNRAPTRLAAFAVAHMCVSALLRTEACEVSLHIRPKRSLSSNDEDLPLRPPPRKPVDLCASKQSFARASKNCRGNCCDMHNRSELHRVALREYRPICTIAYVSASRCWHPESYHGYAYRVSRLHVLIETRRTAYDPDMEQSDSGLHVIAEQEEQTDPITNIHAHRHGIPLPRPGIAAIFSRTASKTACSHPSVTILALMIRKCDPRMYVIGASNVCNWVVKR